MIKYTITIEHDPRHSDEAGAAFDPPLDETKIKFDNAAEFCYYRMADEFSRILSEVLEKLEGGADG